MKKIITALFSVIIVCGCNLDYAPQNTLVDQTVYKREKTADAAVNGAYVALNEFIGGQYRSVGQVVYIDGDSYLFADIGTPNITVKNYDSFKAMENSDYSTDLHDGFILDCYRAGYNAIDYANAVIYGVTEYGQYDSTMMVRHIAEAKFVRAYAYMYLLQMYGDGTLSGGENGLGLVLRTDPYQGYNPDEVQARETVGTIYDQIIKDVTEAVPGLPASEYVASNRIRATQGVCKAFLSRVYLYRGSYTGNKEYLNLSAQYASEVLDGGGFSFSSQYNDHRQNLFPSNVEVDGTCPNPTNHSNELILFQPSRISSNDYGCGLNSYYSKMYYSVDPDFAASYSAGDLRGNVAGSSDCLIGQGSAINNPKDITTLKYDNEDGYNDVIYIRLSEVKLNYAEAAVRVSGSVTQAAVDRLNDIRCKPFAEGSKPRKYSLSDFSSADAFIAEVLKERNRELAFEGHYRWDLMRTGRKLRNTSVPENKMMLPIPQYEVNISNGAIKQNTGYAAE